MSLLPVISKLSMEGRSSTTTMSVLPSRRSCTSRKSRWHTGADRLARALRAQVIADVYRQVVVDRALGDTLQTSTRMSPTVKSAGPPPGSPRLRERQRAAHRQRQGGKGMRCFILQPPISP